MLAEQDVGDGVQAEQEERGEAGGDEVEPDGGARRCRQRRGQREQLDSLFAARELGVASVQEYLDSSRVAKEIA